MEGDFVSRFDFDNLTWKCAICGLERPDEKISVFKVDIGPRDLPTGTVVRNVKYCNDNPRCYDGARNWNEENFRARQRVREIS
jgi:hypothetical protein